MVRHQRHEQRREDAGSGAVQQASEQEHDRHGQHAGRGRDRSRCGALDAGEVRHGEDGLEEQRMGAEDREDLLQLGVGGDRGRLAGIHRLVRVEPQRVEIPQAQRAAGDHDRHDEGDVDEHDRDRDGRAPEAVEGGRERSPADVGNAGIDAAQWRTRLALRRGAQGQMEILVGWRWLFRLGHGDDGKRRQERRLLVGHDRDGTGPALLDERREHLCPLVARHPHAPDVGARDRTTQQLGLLGTQGLIVIAADPQLRSERRERREAIRVIGVLDEALDGVAAPHCAAAAPRRAP